MRLELVSLILLTSDWCLLTPTYSRYPSLTHLHDQDFNREFQFELRFAIPE